MDERMRIIIAAGLVAAALSACGGGGGGKPGGAAMANGPPAAAGASVGGFLSFLGTLTGSASETAEPLDLDGFVAPTSDSDEPSAI